MPRKPKFPPSILPHKPSGRDRVRWRGVEYPLGPTGSEESRREYARLIKLFAADLDAPPPPRQAAPSRITVNEAVALWDEKASAALAPKEAQSHRRALLVVCRVCGTRKLADFDAAALGEVQAAMLSGSWMRPAERERAAQSGKPVDWCASVVNRRIGRVKNVWRWLELNKIAPRGCSGELSLLKGITATDRRARHRPRTRPADGGDLEALLRFLRAPAVRAMLRVQWWTGMRSGELRVMRAGEVDRSGEVWLYRPSSHKNDWRGQERVIAIGPQAQAVLGPRLDCRRPGEYVFTNRKGTPYSSEMYANMVGRAARRAGRPWVRPLSFRHGARLRVTRALNLDAARAVLGHASATMTTHYAHGVDVQTAMAAALVSG
jgi:integrase